VTRLLGIELRRFLQRRLTRFACVGLLIAVIAVGIGAYVTTGNDLAAAQRTAQRHHDEFVQSQVEGRRQCLTQVPADQTPDQFCGPADAELPPVRSFYVDPRFSFHDHVRDLVRTGVVVGALVALLLCASFIGAEWQAGTLSALLTWEPRRARVAVAKVTAATAASVAVAATWMALLVAAAALVAATHGTMHTVLQVDPSMARDVHFTRAVCAMAARGLAAVAVIGVAGAALALLLRHTVAALGVAVGYLIVGEGLIGQLHSGDLRHHLLQSRLNALVNGTYSWPIPIRGPGGGIEYSPEHLAVVHASRAAPQLVAVALVLLAVATIVFSRRDVS
jgi:ABC-2 type transport system permease protein